MKPILFSTPMVQAILAGHKTMTRRIVKFPDWLKINPGGSVVGGSVHDNGINPDIKSAAEYWKLPHHQKGDVLWVRETFTVMYPSLPNGRIDYDHEDVFYAANKLDADTVKTTYVRDDDGFDTGRTFPWKPSIFMPLKYSRIFLRVTGVRAERIQEITVSDIRAEGLTSMGVFAGDREIAIKEWELLWNKLNAARGYGWDKNPWVWVYTFERITREEAMEANT